MPDESMQTDARLKKFNKFSNAGQVIPKEELNVFKQILTGSYIFVFLLASSLSAHAQVPKPASPSASPSASPPASPSSQPQVPATSQTKVNPDELQKFARSLKQLLVIEQGANQQIVQLIGQSGLSQPRFLEIYKAQRTPSAQPTKAVTSQEKQQFDKAFTSLRSIQQEANTKMQQVLQKEGLNPESFNKIEAAVRQDPALQQKVREIIQS
ncbi:hypothetical protein SAMD00079811_49300 [Scytonema sp. HK-05]|uniref:DUF4168 domain-containing protein n=1 Tax=Scytonema sp. HK-05 TaxID=1137095 RepID=UPI000B5FBF9B|nr:DUF4168 domain-containing protein [Scytonema sp. HK-05]BAY47312.1 hypothetical protein SAMD00079811_49300 [Scytonema sp. HK-05]